MAAPEIVNELADWFNALGQPEEDRPPFTVSGIRRGLDLVGTQIALDAALELIADLAHVIHSEVPARYAAQVYEPMDPQGNALSPKIALVEV